MDLKLLQLTYIIKEVSKKYLKNPRGLCKWILYGSCFIWTLIFMSFWTRRTIFSQNGLTYRSWLVFVLNDNFVNSFSKVSLAIHLYMNARGNILGHL